MNPIICKQLILKQIELNNYYICCFNYLEKIKSTYL